MFAAPDRFAMVAVVPEPPLLVPELATGAVEETADLRAAVLAAARALAGAARTWIAVGSDGTGRRTVDPATRATFAAFGADVPVALAPHAQGPADPDLPLPLLVAGWLAGQVGGVSVRGELVDADAPVAECRALGAALAAEAAAAPEPIGLLVVGDGAATHSESAPGHRDDRAGPFDHTVATALAAADPTALAALDPATAHELMASGRAPWQVLAGATGDGAWTAEVLYSGAPFGVAYHVAVWRPRPPEQP